MTQGVVLGWARRLVLAFNELGHETITVLDRRNWTAATNHPIPGNRYLFVERHHDVEEVLSALGRHGVDRQRLEFIVAGDEFAVTAAATLCTASGLPTMPITTALTCRDKYLQKQAIQAAGLRCAPHALLDPVASARASSPELAGLLPGVVKPVAGASVTGTVAVADEAHLAAHLAALTTDGATAHLLEQQVRGCEVHADGVVVDGQLHAVGLSRYRQNLLDIHDGIVAGSVTLDPGDHAERYATAGPFVEACLCAVGLTDGVFHLEMFETPDGWVFGEVAARAGGGLIVDAVARKFGIHLQRARAHIALGLPPAPPSPIEPLTVGWTLLGLPPGLIASLPSADELSKRPGVELVRLTVQRGDVMPDMRTSTAHSAGFAMLVASDDAELEKQMDDLNAWIATEARII